MILAKKQDGVIFKGARIDMENMIISETTKDEFREYSLTAVLKEWDGIDDITFSIRKVGNLPSLSDE